MTIGQAIKKHRKLAGMTLQMLSDNMQANSGSGYTCADICKIENGSRDPSWFSIRAIAREIGPGFLLDALGELP